MGKTTKQIDVEVRETLRALAESSWEPVNETLRRLLEMETTDDRRHKESSRRGEEVGE